MRVLSLFILLTSCAHSPKTKELIESGEISLKSVSDLARSSYLRGCVESKSKLSFGECAMKAKAHEKEIREILK